MTSRPTGEGAAVMMDAPPSITLFSGARPTTSYVGQNAFGVTREVELAIETKIVLIPIGKITGPRGCDFRAGDSSSDYRRSLVDAASLANWACGNRYVDTEKIETLARFSIPMNADAAREVLAAPIFVAYVISFDGLPASLEAHAGPMMFSRTHFPRSTGEVRFA